SVQRGRARAHYVATKGLEGGERKGLVMEECTPREELRPDTPPPQSSSQGSSRGGTSIRALAPTSSDIDDDCGLYEVPSVNHASNPFFIDDQRTPTPSDAESRAPTPLPTAEYNEHGCQTARSKGKGRARD
ncbi:hypothetical protein FRC06_010187, partial [Ceratobasidium sp. 370]